jgi:hypothetical protein
MFPPVQVDGPQVTDPPQPSAIDPQFIPAGHCVIGWHSGLPHTFCVPPPPQISPALGQVEPQSRIPPHPSASLPQLAFAVWQVSGTQAPPSGPTRLPPPQTLGVPPPPQVFG